LFETAVEVVVVEGAPDTAELFLKNMSLTVSKEL
jgi:hypothetical protein